MKQKIVITLIAFLMAVHLNGQSKRMASIDSILTEMTRQDRFSGAVLIADRSGVLLSKGYGYSDREHKIKNTPDTRFSLSSGSKIFTGTAIACLAQEGKLKVTDTLGQYLKGFAGEIRSLSIRCLRIRRAWMISLKQRISVMKA